MIKNNSILGVNPSFDETFQFEITVPELALVRFLVLDDDYIDDDFIGQYTVPFECLQNGWLFFIIKICMSLLKSFSKACSFDRRNL